MPGAMYRQLLNLCTNLSIHQLEAFGVGHYLSNSATANARSKQRREKLCNNIENMWSYRVAWLFVSKT